MSGWVSWAMGKGQAAPAHSDDEDHTEVMGEESRSLVAQLLASGSLSADLSKVALPTFVLEPRSLLQTLTGSFAHPDALAAIAECDDPAGRMVAATRWFLSALHDRPRGVKKPFNPVLGETYKALVAAQPGCGNAVVHSVAQQVSHHPPVSAVYAECWADGAAAPAVTRDGAGEVGEEEELLGRGEPDVAVQATFAPTSSYLGNSAATHAKGGVRLWLPKRGEVYYVSWPVTFVRGILMGKLQLEHGGTVQLRCPATGLQASLDFAVVGYFSGEYHRVSGAVYPDGHPSRPLYTIGGRWVGTTTAERCAATTDATHAAVLKALRAPPGEAPSSVPLFVSRASAPAPQVPLALPEAAWGKQPETLRMWPCLATWAGLAEAIRRGDGSTATAAKHLVEEEQRRIRRARDESPRGPFEPSLFEPGPEPQCWAYKHAGDFPAPEIAFADIEPQPPKLGS